MERTVPSSCTSNDSIQTTVGWEYNPTDNAIDFDPDHVPDGGEVITVEYTLFGDCEQ